MSIDVNDEILQDFLLEAGEILERLDEELVDLEQRPDDSELLNAVFRGFHTIKGGASFLSLDGLVEVCHVAEDVFNVLRNGERCVDAQLMDTMLQVLDVVTDMFTQVQNGETPAAADPQLIEALRGMALPAGAQADSAQPAIADSVKQDADTVSANADIGEDEFDALLDQLHGAGKGPSSPVGSQSEGAEITAAEFDALLDDLHGKGKGPTSAAARKKPAAEVQARQAEQTTPGAEQKKPAMTSSARAEATVRVDTTRLDQIMNMVGELVLVRNRLANLRENIPDGDMSRAISNLDVVTSDLQSAVMKTRMQPVKKVFGRFPRVVRDLARSLHKEVELVLKGEDTDLDKNLVEALADPLVHLVRNAVDHGIEPPDEREAAGKPRAGTVVLSAEQEGDHILLSIKDDGKGMDPEKLREIAVTNGLMDENAAAKLTDRECYNLIFAAGFSTKEEISDVSGRGVGMDVVKTRIGQLNGTVEIDSQTGHGSCLMIRVPLTLAIMPTLMVKLGEQPFALPLGSVSEIFDLDTGHTSHIDGQLVVNVRDKALPLFFLRDWLVDSGMAGKQENVVSHVVVMHVGDRRVGFAVEQLVGQEEVVIKPLGAFLQGMTGFAGATITGDGRIALILDVPGLMKAYVRRM